MKSKLSSLALGLLLVGAIASAFAGESTNADWLRMVEHAPFSARDTAEGVWFRGKLWLSNGYLSGEKLVRDLWSSTDATNWTLVSTNTPYDGYAEVAVFDNKLWAVKQSVWNSDDGVNWQRVAEKTPFGIRGYGELVVHQDRMWQLGSGADVWNTTNGVAWTCATSNAPYGPRFASACVSFQGKLWVMGARWKRPTRRRRSCISSSRLTTTCGIPPTAQAGRAQSNTRRGPRECGLCPSSSPGGFGSLADLTTSIAATSATFGGRRMATNGTS